MGRPGPQSSTSSFSSEIRCSEAFRPTRSSSESTPYLLRSVFKLMKLGRLEIYVQKYMFLAHFVCLCFAPKLVFLFYSKCKHFVQQSRFGLVPSSAVYKLTTLGAQMARNL